MSPGKGFPATGFLVLSMLGLIVTIPFVVRSNTVDATAEQIWSAVLLGGFSVFWPFPRAIAHRSATVWLPQYTCSTIDIGLLLEHIGADRRLQADEPGPIRGTER